LSGYGWRSVLLLAYLPLLLLPVLYYGMPESIRFLAQKGRFEEAIRVIRRMEKAAGVLPSEWTKASFAVSAAPRVGIRQLLASKLMTMTLLIWVVYFCNLMVIYALTTWLPTLLISAGVSRVGSYGYTSLNHLGGAAGAAVLGFILDRLGRKKGLASAYVLAGIALYIFGYLTGSPTGLVIFGAAAGFFVNGAQSAQHAVTAEIYPTSMRSTGVGWALTIGRFGAVCGPLLGGKLQKEGFTFSQYFAIFAIPCILCALFVCFYRVNVKGESLEDVQQRIKT
jgi:pentatricopeptide repeat protein